MTSFLRARWPLVAIQFIQHRIIFFSLIRLRIIGTVNRAEAKHRKLFADLWKITRMKTGRRIFIQRAEFLIETTQVELLLPRTDRKSKTKYSNWFISAIASSTSWFCCQRRGKRPFPFPLYLLAICTARLLLSITLSIHFHSILGSTIQIPFYLYQK